MGLFDWILDIVRAILNVIKEVVTAIVNIVIPAIIVICIIWVAWYFMIGMASMTGAFSAMVAWASSNFVLACVVFSACMSLLGFLNPSWAKSWGFIGGVICFLLILVGVGLLLSWPIITSLMEQTICNVAMTTILYGLAAGVAVSLIINMVGGNKAYTEGFVEGFLVIPTAVAKIVSSGVSNLWPYLLAAFVGYKLITSSSSDESSSVTVVSSQPEGNFRSGTVSL